MFKYLITQKVFILVGKARPSMDGLDPPLAPNRTLARDPPESWNADIGLPRIAAHYLWWGLSTNTRRTYDTARRSYVTC